KSVGYPPEFAGATEACASTGGQLVPPVMGAACFIMAESRAFRLVIAQVHETRGPYRRHRIAEMPSLYALLRRQQPVHSRRGKSG
ncbi:MAG: TRAP transporter large permease subunit, partial [Bacteroidaceae bacterium]|nr:TRAP transporter large permease subunit [Bacteroidaceae bacterium]